MRIAAGYGALTEEVLAESVDAPIFLQFEAIQEALFSRSLTHKDLRSEPKTMSTKIDKFCESLRLKLTKWESELNGLKSDVKTVEQEGEAAIESKLKAARLSVETQEEAVKVAGAKAKSWLNAKGNASVAVVQGWKDRHEQRKLDHHADQAEENAEAAICLAEAAITEAIVATYEAMATRLATAQVIAA